MNEVPAMVWSIVMGIPRLDILICINCLAVWVYYRFSCDLVIQETRYRRIGGPEGRDYLQKSHDLWLNISKNTTTTKLS